MFLGRAWSRLARTTHSSFFLHKLASRKPWISHRYVIAATTLKDGSSKRKAPHTELVTDSPMSHLLVEEAGGWLKSILAKFRTNSEKFKGGTNEPHIIGTVIDYRNNKGQGASEKSEEESLCDALKNIPGQKEKAVWLGEVVRHVLSLPNTSPSNYTFSTIRIHGAKLDYNHRSKGIDREPTAVTIAIQILCKSVGPLSINPAIEVIAGFMQGLGPDKCTAEEVADTVRTVTTLMNWQLDEIYYFFESWWKISHCSNLSHEGIGYVITSAVHHLATCHPVATTPETPVKETLDQRKQPIVTVRRLVMRLLPSLGCKRNTDTRISPIPSSNLKETEKEIEADRQSWSWSDAIEESSGSSRWSPKLSLMIWQGAMMGWRWKWNDDDIAGEVLAASKDFEKICNRFHSRNAAPITYIIIGELVSSTAKGMCREGDRLFVDKMLARVVNTWKKDQMSEEEMSQIVAKVHERLLPRGGWLAWLGDWTNWWKK